jgi:hypothetical protein
MPIADRELSPRIPLRLNAAPAGRHSETPLDQYLESGFGPADCGAACGTEWYG